TSSDLLRRRSFTTSIRARVSHHSLPWAWSWTGRCSTRSTARSAAATARRMPLGRDHDRPVPGPQRDVRGADHRPATLAAILHVPMRILVINPNTSDEMTRDIHDEATRYARAGTEVETVSPAWGPRSIEGHYDDILAAAATLEVVRGRAAEFDGVVVACFGDPGLFAAREVSPVPVVGIAEASMLVACTVAHRFSVVTVLPRVQPWIEDTVRLH